MVNSSAVNPGSTSAAAKKTVSLEEWNQKLRDVKINQSYALICNLLCSELNLLVMDFFEVEGYYDAAEKFAQECSNLSGQLSDDTVTSMRQRAQIRSCITDGNIDRSIQLINEYNPAVLDHNQRLFFALQQQKLVELIRCERLEEALEFAQEDLAPLAEENPEFLEQLERTMALLAFDLKANEAVVEVLNPLNRQRVAHQVNEALLEASGREKESRLVSVLKLLAWGQTKLQERLNFPVIRDFAHPDPTF